MRKLFSLLHHIKEQNTEILNWIGKQPNVVTKNNTVGLLPNNIPINLPVDEIADLLQLEDYLKIEENFGLLVIYISNLSSN